MPPMSFLSGATMIEVLPPPPSHRKSEELILFLASRSVQWHLENWYAKEAPYVASIRRKMRSFKALA
jgi:hypothetical protein